MILVVDDHADTLKVLVLLLDRYGYEVTSATSGPEALAQMAIAPPRCVVLDYNMPEMNGLEVLAAIRAEPRYEAVRVVLFTAAVDPGIEARALAAGADRVVWKASLDFAALDRVLRELCCPAHPPTPFPQPPECKAKAG